MADEQHNQTLGPSEETICLQPYPGKFRTDPRFYRTTSRRAGSPLIFFIHFYGGHQKVLRRHVNLVNEMGYDAFAFNLPNFEQNSSGLWVRGQFGLKHLYADMIRFYVDQIPGEKILFSFSNPSAAAIEILAEKFQKNEAQSFKGLICDSGPSLAFVRSAWNLAIMSQRNPYLFASFSAFWSWKLHRDLPGQLATFPKDFPILSIRGTQDLIIPPWHIERVFENSGLPNVSTFELPEAGHLDGLKRFTDSYRKTLSQWLEQF